MMLGIKKTLFLLLVCLAVASWGIGFLSFVQTVGNYRQPVISAALAPTQAIVVLTGGSERVTAGLDLLKEGRGVKLLISGVHAGVRNSEILPINSVPPELQECCLVLGRVATNTRGNAAEAQAFMEQYHYDTMRLVTANYHMPRSLLLFQSAMPDKRITPFPVQPDIVNLDSWWRWPGTFSLLLLEYHKYLFVKLSLMLGAY